MLTLDALRGQTAAALSARPLSRQPGVKYHWGQIRCWLDTRFPVRSFGIERYEVSGST